MNIDDLKTSIGRKIYELRKKHSYSKKYIREKTDISEQMQKQYEDGTTKKLPSTDILFRLSEFYNVPLNYFFSDTWSEVSKPQKRTDSLLDIAKLLVDLSTNNDIYLSIEKKDTATTIPELDIISGTYQYIPKKLNSFKFEIYDYPDIVNHIKTEESISQEEYKKFINESILYKFYDKLLTYMAVYKENKIDLEDYNTLCEKALKIVEKEEKSKFDFNFDFDFDNEIDDEDFPF